MKVKQILVVATALALSGCAVGYTLVASGERAKVGTAMSVDPGGIWNWQILGDMEIWTIDGPALQELRFLPGVGDGDPLNSRSAAPLSNPQREQPKFRADMTPIDVAELVVASMAQIGIADVETRNLRPAKLGMADGFRFDLRYTQLSGVECEGLAVGAIKDKKLYLVMYRAPKLHYFGRDRERVERMISSIRIDA